MVSGCVGASVICGWVGVWVQVWFVVGGCLGASVDCGWWMCGCVCGLLLLDVWVRVWFVVGVRVGASLVCG